MPVNEYYQLNKERIVGTNKLYYQQNKERIIATNKLYYQKNKKKCLKRAAAYRKKGKTQRKLYDQQRKKNSNQIVQSNDHIEQPVAVSDEIDLQQLLKDFTFQ